LKSSKNYVFVSKICFLTPTGKPGSGTYALLAKRPAIDQWSEKGEPGNH